MLVTLGTHRVKEDMYKEWVLAMSNTGKDMQNKQS